MIAVNKKNGRFIIGAVETLTAVTKIEWDSFGEAEPGYSLFRWKETNERETISRTSLRDDNYNRLFMDDDQNMITKHDIVLMTKEEYKKQYPDTYLWPNDPEWEQ